MAKKIKIDTVYWFIRKTVGTAISAIWIKKVFGKQNIPKKGSAILAFNHQSYFDFLCFASISPRNIYFLSAEKFFAHPIWKHVMKYTGQIKVDRISGNKNDTHQSVYDHLTRGNLIGIFPEGTRSPHEKDMLRAFVGIAKYSISQKTPIIPVGIRGTYNVLSKSQKRLKFKKVVEFHIGEPMHFPDYHDKAEINQKDYAEITHKVMLKIAELSGKSYSHNPYDN